LNSTNKIDRFKNEIVAGGSVTEVTDDELVDGRRALVSGSIILGLFAWLWIISPWMVLFVVGVLVAIFFHEVGHFVTARWTGMKATQFFMGFGPRLWSVRRGETEYGVRALPLGAFVRIIGMNNMDDVPIEDEPRTYRQQSFPKRMLVISAGSIMHVLMAIVLLFAVYAAHGEFEGDYEQGVEISALTAGGPAQEAGLLVGDRILAIEGIAVAGDDFVDVVRANRPGDVVTLDIVRDGEPMRIDVGLGANTVEGDPNFGKALIGVSSSGIPSFTQHGIVDAARNAVTDVFPVAWESVQGVVKAINPVNIVDHLTGRSDDLSTRPTTVVGITSVSDDVGEAEGLVGILYVLAVLNVVLGVFNMFPLLPLDGGHAAIAVYERIRSRRGRRYFADVSKLMPVAVAVITLLGFLFLTGLYLDITDPIG
jgi:membrane-associated protease RseP (regulator of RpoE activity)